MSYEIIDASSYQFIVPSPVLLEQLINSKKLFKDLDITYKNKAKKDIAYILQVLLQDLLIDFHVQGLLTTDYKHTQLTPEDKSLLLKEIGQFVETIIDILENQLKNFSPTIIQAMIVDSIKVCGGILISLFALIFGLTTIQAAQYLFAEITSTKIHMTKFSDG